MSSEAPEADGNDVLNDQAPAPEQALVTLEILENSFDRDESPNVKVPPVDISVNEEGYVTVWRGDTFATTLYDPSGRVADTFPTEYLLKRQGDNNTAEVIGDGSKEYLMLPSSYKGVVIREVNRVGDCVMIRNQRFKIKEGVVASAKVLDFLFGKGFCGGSYNEWYLNQQSAVVWEDLIQTGKIRFIDEEKLENISMYTPGPLLSQATSNVQEAINGARIVTNGAQRKSLILGRRGEICQFDWESDIAVNWSVEALQGPEGILSFEDVTALGLDPRGNFIFVGCGVHLYVMDPHTTPMTVVGSLKQDNVSFKGVIRVQPDGSLLVGDDDGGLTTILTNVHAFASHEERVNQERALKRLRIIKRKAKVKEEHKEKQVGILPEIQEMIDDISRQFVDDISEITTLEDIESVKADIHRVKAEYVEAIQNSTLIESAFGPILELVKEKETEILSAQIEEEITVVRGLMDRIDGMSLADLATARQQVDRVKATIMGSNLDAAKKREISGISDAFCARAAEVLGKDEEKLVGQLDDLLVSATTQLESIDKLSDFEIWKSTDYPAFLEALSAQMRIIPASHKAVIEKIRKMETDLRGMKKQYDIKFKEHYETVRQEASDRIDVVIGLAMDRIDEFLENLESEVSRKSFKTPKDAKQWTERSPLYESAVTMIADLKINNPEKAEELDQKLKIGVAQRAYEVKLAKGSTVEEGTGRQMATFGKERFPIWEHKVEGKKSIKIELTYKVDNTSKGPGIRPEDYMCELFYKVTDENGKVQEIPMHADDPLKYGRYNEAFREGETYFPSHLRMGNARKMLSSVKTMESKKGGDVKRKYEEFRAKIKELNKKIKEIKKENDGNWDNLKKERADLGKEYVTFLHESGLYGWFKLKALEKRCHRGEDPKGSMGQGRIPAWEPYWIVDKATEESLEKFAAMANMQVALKEGMTSLEGHSGTGKDVLVQMFAHKTKRPLYSFDCSKWTTEFDLSQDVTLESEGGASFTKMVDSIVVKAIETPGAILYFNEFNTLPRQAQTYLHSLLDAKRQITLKTSSSKVVKADPEVIICGSMNPGYPDTNHPQFATRDRMIPIKVEFPEFKKADGTFASAEALRIARSVKSLKDLTHDPDMDENEFGKLWDDYINKGISNGNLTPERKFDIETIFALITFGEKIREGFINKISKRTGRGTFNVSQVFTLRGMRRCSFMLNRMDPSEKQNPDNAESVAKDLIRKFFSQYIFDEKEAEALEKQLVLWTTQKPVRVSP